MNCSPSLKLRSVVPLIPYGAKLATNILLPPISSGAMLFVSPTCSIKAVFSCAIDARGETAIDLSVPKRAGAVFLERGSRIRLIVITSKLYSPVQRCSHPASRSALKYLMSLKKGEVFKLTNNSSTEVRSQTLVFSEEDDRGRGSRVRECLAEELRYLRRKLIHDDRRRQDLEYFFT